VFQFIFCVSLSAYVLFFLTFLRISQPMFSFSYFFAYLSTYVLFFLLFCVSLNLCSLFLTFLRISQRMFSFSYFFILYFGVFFAYLFQRIFSYRILSFSLNTSSCVGLLPYLSASSRLIR
jgi:hypothetical protein